MAGFLLHGIQTEGGANDVEFVTTSDFSGDVSGQLSQAAKRAAGATEGNRVRRGFVAFPQRSRRWPLRVVDV
jgi:hypothetical protein